MGISKSMTGVPWHIETLEDNAGYYDHSYNPLEAKLKNKNIIYNINEKNNGKTRSKFNTNPIAKRAILPRSGQRVSHSKYGTGNILRIIDKTIYVRFDNGEELTCEFPEQYSKILSDVN